MSEYRPESRGKNPKYESIIDSTDGQAWETLREAGVEKGEVFPVGSLQGMQQNASTSADSFGAFFRILDRVVVENFGVPSNTEAQVRLSASLKSDSSTESVTIRAAGVDTGAVSAELSVVSTLKEQVTTGWTDPPNTPSSADRILLEGKTSGSNSGLIESLRFEIGVKI